jgi:hypothetical protein
VLRQEPRLQGGQCEVRLGFDMDGKSGFLRRVQFAWPVTASRTGLRLSRVAAPKQRLVDVGHADPEKTGRRPHRQAAIDRPQNPRPQIVRVALPPPPSHRQPHNISRSGQRITLSLVLESPFRDSSQSGNALTQ